MNKKQEESHLSEMARQALEDSEKWFGDQDGLVFSLPYYTLALCGEAGELANLVKKVERGSLDIKNANTRYELMMETTDVFVYLLNVAAVLGLDLDKSYQHVRSLNEKRFTAQRTEREAKANG